MAQQIKALTTSPNNLSLTPRAHIIERTDSRKLSSDHHKCTIAYMHTHTQIGIRDLNIDSWF